MAARQWLETRLFNSEVLSAAAPLTKSLFHSSNSESGYLLAYGFKVKIGLIFT